MEALGINVVYLLGQIFCMFILPLIIVISILYWVIKRVNERNYIKEENLVANITPTDEGIVIPLKLLPDSDNFAVYQQEDKIILIPKGVD